jgi:hypothetical protein
MMHFTVQDNSPADGGCQKCCCEKMAFKPGTVNKVSVGYAPWAVPIGQLHCAPQFMIEQLATCPAPVGSNMPPAASGDVKFGTPKDTKLVAADLATIITDPEALPLTFKLLELYGPKYGKLELDPAGTFDYTPGAGFTGVERFYVSASDGVNTVTVEVMVAVGVDVATVIPTPHVSVGPASVDSRYFTVSFPVIVTPAAAECEIWKLTVLQTALDCDCQCYTRKDCFDIAVAAC